MFDNSLRTISMAVAIAAMLAATAARAADDPPPNVYQTYGVHNSPSDSPCANPNCVYTREPGQPSDPRYPDY